MQLAFRPPGLGSRQREASRGMGFHPAKLARESNWRPDGYHCWKFLGGGTSGRRAKRHAALPGCGRGTGRPWMASTLTTILPWPERVRQYVFVWQIRGTAQSGGMQRRRLPSRVVTYLRTATCGDSLSGDITSRVRCPGSVEARIDRLDRINRGIGQSFGSAAWPSFRLAGR